MLKQVLLLQRENPLFICLLLTIFDRMEVGSQISGSTSSFLKGIEKEKYIKRKRGNYQSMSSEFENSFAVDIPSKIVYSLKYHHSLLADTLVRIKKN